MFRIKDQSLLILYFLTFSRYSYPHQSLPLRQIIPNSVKACSLRSILLKIFSLNSHAHFSAPLHTQPSRKVKVKLLSCIQLFGTPRTVDYQAPPSMGFSRQEYWSGLPFPSPGDLPDPRIEPRSPALQADAFPNCHFLSYTQVSDMALFFIVCFYQNPYKVHFCGWLITLKFFF